MVFLRVLVKTTGLDTSLCSCFSRVCLQLIETHVQGSLSGCEFGDDTCGNPPHTVCSGLQAVGITSTWRLLGFFSPCSAVMKGKCRIHHYLWSEVLCGSMCCQENREISCRPKAEEQHPGALPGPLAPRLSCGSWWATWTRGPRIGAGSPWSNRNLSWALPLGRKGKSFFLWSSLKSISNPEVKQRANYINFLWIAMEKFTMFLLFNFFSIICKSLQKVFLSYSKSFKECLFDLLSYLRLWLITQ